MAGLSKYFYGGKKVAYVPTAQAWLEAHCKHVSMSNAKAGDVVIFTWDGTGYNRERGSRDHIGFIRKGGTSSVAYTIEGNTSGGIVAERTRAACYIYGIYRPNFPATKAKTTAAKKTTKSVKTVKISATYRVVSKVGSNIRKSPTTASKRIGGLKYKTRIKCTKKRGSWVYAKKYKGWVCTGEGSKTYLKKI
ncbi:MAG: SH3 domain-containing protein [Anaerovoracaceae bacterium]|jgi:hypothetical protein